MLNQTEVREIAAAVAESLAAMAPQALYSIQRTAKLLDVGETLIRNLIDNGELEVVDLAQDGKGQRKRHVTTQSLTAFIERRKMGRAA